MHIGTRAALTAAFTATLLASVGVSAAAGAAEVNVYSSRHYDVDKALYDTFTQQTGIKVNVIEGKEDELIERMKTEGANSPADVLITVDAGRLWRAQEAGLLQPTRNKALEAAIPAHLREPEGHWFGISKRARIIVYNKATVKPGDLPRYESLAEPAWKGRVLVRGSNSVYNQSLVGSLLAADGEPKTEAWAKGVVANMARKPQGGDTDQIKGVAAGEGDVAVSNTYYFARIASSTKPEDKAIADKLGVIFPNQGDRGTHVNISGAGITKSAPNKQSAEKFLEYLISPDAQRMFTEKNFEYPIVAGAPTAPVLVNWGSFKEDPLNAAVYGKNNAEALKIMDRAGWK